MLSHVAGPNNFLGQTEAKARYSLVQSLTRIWLQQNRIHRSYLEELLVVLPNSLTNWAPGNHSAVVRTAQCLSLGLRHTVNHGRISVRH